MKTIWGTVPGLPIQTKEDGWRTLYLIDGHWTDERWVCHRCLDAEGGVAKHADEQYSLGIYAGKWCEECWEQSGYRKEGPGGFHPDDAGESY